MKTRNLCQLIALLLCAAAQAAGATEDDLAKGHVIERVVCHTDATQSYALYLPASYTPDKKFPIIYAFDPGGRGARPVELFKDAAEQYGYIVVGSHNSRNGIGVTEIVQTLWADTHARFALDERRTYTAGFSGGARVATYFAYVANGQIAGVIACSGGFSSNMKPTRALPFVLFGTTGTDDFNHPELRQLNRTLDALNVPNQLAIFAGGHDWPPREVCKAAVEWLELQAMRAGSRPRDEALIEQLFKTSLAAAHAAEAAQKSYDAYVAYDALVREFKGLREVSEDENNLRQLAASKEVKQTLKQERDEETQQAKRADELQAHVPPAEGYPADILAQTLADFRSDAARLRRQAEDATDTSARRVARRVLNGAFVQFYEQAAALRQQKKYTTMAAQLELAVALKPDSARALAELAAAYALAGQKRPALQTLRRAADKGFTDAALLEQSADFTTLRQEAEFKQLIADLKKAGATATP